MAPVDANLFFESKKAEDIVFHCPKFQSQFATIRHRYFSQLTGDGDCAFHDDASGLVSNSNPQAHSPFCTKHPLGFFRPQSVSSILSVCLTLFGSSYLCGCYDPSIPTETPAFINDQYCSTKGHFHSWNDTCNHQFLLKDSNSDEIKSAIACYVEALELYSEKNRTEILDLDSMILPVKWNYYFYHPTLLSQFLCPQKIIDFKRIECIIRLTAKYSIPSTKLWHCFFNQLVFGLDYPKEENALAMVCFFYYFDAPPSELILRFCNIILNADSQFRKVFANAIMRFEGGYSREHASKVLTRIVNSLNQHISQSCELTDLSDSKITDAVKTISLFDEINCKYNLVPIALFYNAEVNDMLNIRQDFPRWKAKEGFSYCSYPFILNTATKSLVLRIENMVQMRHELQSAFFKSMFIGPQSPYLELTVHRDRLIRDTIFQLQGKSPHDLRKQLRVRFIDEPGVDEGGVQKEFFHLIIKNIFKEEYGMFTISNGVRWFRYNCTFDNAVLEEYELVGKLIGLAIYNSVFLDLHFPMVLYKKLTEEPLYLKDLKEINPDLAKGLEQLALFDGDIQNTYLHSFAIDIELVDGNINSIELCPGGKERALTNENRDEYIKLCLEYYLHASINERFEAFKKGFDLVTKSSSIRLFKAEELFQLLVGESVLDFHALESKTQYDGGYTAQTPIIIAFWQLVHEMTLEDQKKLLFFVTGSLRAPIGGLSQLNFVISRNGPDSNRLPTSHTCFNVLLLPEYSDMEKMKKLLFLATENLEGFGLF